MSNLKEIGKNTQFPNNPINKKGAPKGKRVSTILKELLDVDISTFDKTKKGMNVNQALAVELLAMAFHSDNTPSEKINAIKTILERIEGKPQQSIEIGQAEQKVINIKPIHWVS